MNRNGRKRVHHIYRRLGFESNDPAESRENKVFFCKAKNGKHPSIASIVMVALWVRFAITSILIPANASAFSLGLLNWLALAKFAH